MPKRNPEFEERRQEIKHRKLLLKEDTKVLRMMEEIDMDLPHRKDRRNTPGAGRPRAYAELEAELADHVRRMVLHPVLLEGDFVHDEEIQNWIARINFLFLSSYMWGYLPFWCSSLV